MLLQSNPSFDTLAEYDPETGRFETFSRRAEPTRVTGPICGEFDYLDGKRVMLYRLGDNLYLEIDGQKLPLDKHTVELRRVNGRRLLQVLFTDGRVVTELIYDPPKIDPPLHLDPTPGVEEEHFDFGLFLHNVSHNPPRQMRMYRSR
jgi:hypothetical protein